MTNSAHSILIVDDEEQVLDSLRRTLRHQNYTIITTTSPIDALGYLQAGDIDILISDIDMPEMTGLELVAQVRKNHPQVVRILLTGDSSLQSAISAINDGAVHKYLTKPWSAKDLRETLRATVGAIAVMRQQAEALSWTEREEQRRKELEREYPGITRITQVEGAYLLNDMRVVELLNKLGADPEEFAATRWLPNGNDATVDIGPA